MIGTKFRIAHVSDLHLSERPGDKGLSQWSRWWRQILSILPGLVKGDYRPWMQGYQADYLRALTRALGGNSYYNDVPYDGYIFSGDLATTGLRRDIAVAAAYLHGRPMYEVSGYPLTLPPLHTALAPGNHDRYGGNTLLPISEEFELGAHFGNEWTVAGNGKTSGRVGVNCSTFTKESVRLGIVCADFSYNSGNCPRFWPRYLGGGRVEQETIDEMVNRTELFRKQGIPSIWVVHHPPVTGVGFFMSLCDARRLGDAAIDSRVKYILSGHSHEHSAYKYAETNRKVGGPVRVICAGSATAYGQGQRSYYEIVFSVTNGLGVDPEARIFSIRPMFATDLGLREKRVKGARRWEFKPKKPLSKYMAA